MENESQKRWFGGIFGWPFTSILGGFLELHGENNRGEEEEDDGQPIEDGRRLQGCLLSLEGDC